MNIPHQVNTSPTHHYSPNRPHGLPLPQPCVQTAPVNVPHSPPRRLSYSDVAQRALQDLVVLSREKDAACRQWYANEAETARKSCQSTIDNQTEEHDERVGRLIHEHIHEIQMLKDDHRQHLEDLHWDQENDKEEALKLERNRTWCAEGKLKQVNDDLQQVCYENEWITCSFDQKERECNESTAEVVRMREVFARAERRMRAFAKGKIDEIANEKAEVEQALADCEEKKEAAEEACKKCETELTASKEAKTKTDDKLQNLQTRLSAHEDYEEQSDARHKQLQDEHKQFLDHHKQLLEEHKACNQALDRCKAINVNLRFERDKQKEEINQLRVELQAVEKSKNALEAQKSAAEGNLIQGKRSMAELQNQVAQLKSQKSATEQELASEKQKRDGLQRKVKLLLSVVDNVAN